MRDEIIDRADSRELNDVCQGTAQWRSVRLRRSVGRICPALTDYVQTDTKRNNGGHSDGKFRSNSGPRAPDLRTFTPTCSVSQSGVVSRQREDSRDLNRVRSRPRYVRPTFEASRTGVLSTAD